MTQSQILCFLTVSEKLNISKAAETLFISQPAVSKHISRMENELGVKLFTRKKSKLEITPEGVKCAAFFSEMRERYQDLIVDLQKQEKEVEGNIVIGCADGWDLSDFFAALSTKLKTEHPGIQVSLFSGNHEHLVYALARGEIQFAIDQGAAFIEQNGIVTRPLQPVGMVLLYSSKHPLANCENLSLYDFRDYPFYVTVPKEMDKPILDIIHACNMSGFQPILEYVPTLSAAYVKALCEHGVFVADELLLAKKNPSFYSLKVPGLRYISLARAKKQSSVSDIVEAYIVNYFQNLFGDLTQKERL